MFGAKTLILMVTCLSGLFLSGCNVEHTHTDHYYEETEVHTNYLEPVALNEFGITDSYGFDSILDPLTALYISPYRNFGFFDLYWDLTASERYVVELRVNDIPSTDGSQLVYDEYCGPYSLCHDFQTMSCEYTTDFYLTCSTPSGDTEQSAYIGDQVLALPQRLHLILQVCDEGFVYCEYDTQAVWFE